MLNPEPDYDQYSLASLLEAQHNIDRELYPERALKIDRMILDRKAAGFVAFPKEKKRSLIGAWFVLIYCALGSCTSTIFFLTLISGGFKTARPEFQFQGQLPPLFISIFALVRSLLSLIAAITLVNVRRIAVKLFLIATILELATVPIAYANANNAFQGYIAIVGTVFVSAISAVFYVYAKHVGNKGLLER